MPCAPVNLPTNQQRKSSSHQTTSIRWSPCHHRCLKEDDVNSSNGGLEGWQFWWSWLLSSLVFWLGWTGILGRILRQVRGRLRAKRRKTAITARGKRPTGRQGTERNR